MATIVVPFRGPGGKQRLAPLSDAARAAVAVAMLGDVLAACAEVGPTLVVAPAEVWDAAAETLPAGLVELVPDPGRGQGAAVEAGLARVPRGPVLVVNADLPCATARDLYALLGELPAHGAALAEAADGTTNALALTSASLFEPVYGPGSAARFRALGATPAGVQTVPIPNLVDDVDTLDDLRRLAPRLGPRTARALAAVELPAGAAA
jgi:2-phospho-L-lactate guanylyltransferase